MCEFGESVLFHPLKTNKEKRQKNALAERALDGVWLGTDLKTSTNIIATDSGVYSSQAESFGSPRVSDGAEQLSTLSKDALRSLSLVKEGTSRALCDPNFAEKIVQELRLRRCPPFPMSQRSGPCT